MVGSAKMHFSQHWRQTRTFLAINLTCDVTLQVERSSWEHPWRKSYSVRRTASWEDDARYCDAVRRRPFYRDSRRAFLDLMDLAVFDFLIGKFGDSGSRKLHSIAAWLKVFAAACRERKSWNSTRAISIGFESHFAACGTAVSSRAAAAAV